MKKVTIILIAAFTVCSNAMTQNVGVGTTTPAQKLDVAGNINTSGNLMVNGVAGTNGQVLTMNGGTMQWMDKTRYKNWAIYPLTGAATFAVPSGVTEVLIEMWGAGGGGHFPGGGGGSGGYWTGLIPVVGITTINLTIGAGGASGSTTTAAVDGGNTSFSCTGFNVIVAGGFGADSSVLTNSELFLSGNGGSGQSSATVPVLFRNYFFTNGQDGTPTYINYTEVASGVFTKTSIYGVGGIAPFTNNPVAPASVLMSNTAGTPSYRSQKKFSTFPVNFGCGGSSLTVGGSQNGGPGRIIIYY